MKKSKLLIVLILIMIVTLTGSGCKKNLNYKIKFYDIGYENAFSYASKEYSHYFGVSLTTLIKSYDDLRVMCDEYNNPAFDESSDKYNNEISQMIRTFSKEYFKDKALIITFGRFGKLDAFIHGIESISINYDEVIVDFSSVYPLAYAISSIGSQNSVYYHPYIIMIEINQKDVKKVNYASFTLKYVDAPLDTDIKIIDGKYQNKTK